MTASGQQTARGGQPDPQAAARRQLLAEPRFELMPFDSIEEQVTHLPDDATITITASPSLGLADTVDWSERLAQDGYEVIPHIAARYVEDEDHLADIAQRLQAVGIDDIFVPGGDREDPAGEFESAYELLTALDDLEYEFDEVGITGYPEGHNFLSDEELAESMERKAPYATYITTQICYDPDAIIDWADEIQARGIDLPVEVGIPGVMKYQRLIGISRKVGVGDSVRFLKKTTGIFDFVKQFIGSRGKYSPDELIEGIAPYAQDPNHLLRGVHIYTFNQVPDTESWRHDVLNGS